MKDFSKEWNEAVAAGHAAVAAAVKAKEIQAMVVSQHKDALDDNSPVVQSWYVEDGPCGFAWVSVHPGNCSFANWAKKQKKPGRDCPLFSKAYYGGVQHWVHDYGQSIQKKELFAGAAAEVLRKYGINASSGSRLD